jgi:hypothetical protein
VTLLQQNPEAETSSLLVEYGFGKLKAVFLSETSSSPLFFFEELSLSLLFGSYGFHPYPTPLAWD